MPITKKINALRQEKLQTVKQRHIQNPMFNLKIGQRITDYLNSDNDFYSKIQKLEGICDEFNYTKENKRGEREKILEHAYIGFAIASLNNNDNVYARLGRYVGGIRRSFVQNTFDIATTVQEVYNDSFK
jgi:hypothetical protein